jgi:hypothetical protein
MPLIPIILMILALVFLGLATAAVPSPPRFNWLPAGLFFWALFVALASGVRVS